MILYAVSPIEKCAIIFKLHTFWGSNCTLISVIAHLFNQSEACTFQI